MPFNKALTNYEGQIEDLVSLPIPEPSAIAAVAAAAAFEHVVYVAPHGASGGVTISRLAIYAETAIPAVATNLQTLQFRQWRAGALVGAVGVTYATSTALAAFTERVMSPAAGPVTLRAGDVLTLQSVTGGTGAALPNLVAVVEFSASVAGVDD